MRELVDAAVAAAARAGITAAVVLVDGSAKATGETFVSSTASAQVVEAVSAELSPEEKAKLKKFDEVLERNRTLEGRLVQADAQVAQLNQEVATVKKKASEQIAQITAAQGGGQVTAQMTADLAHAQSSLKAAHAEIAQLKVQLQGSGPNLVNPRLDASGTANAEHEKTIAVLKATIERQERQMKTLDGEIERLRGELANQPVPAAGGTPDQPTAITHLDNEPIEVLGIEAKLTKKFERSGYRTIAELRACLLEGKMREAPLKLKKDDIIVVANKLLARPSGPAPAPAPASGASADDVPEGHADVPWGIRLKAAFKKKLVVQQADLQVIALEKDVIDAENAGAPPEDVASLRAKVKKARDDRDFHHVQQMAFIFSLGLNHKARDIDAALKEAGLERLSQTYQAEQVLAAGAAS